MRASCDLTATDVQVRTWSEDGHCYAAIDELPGCVGDGPTPEVAIEDCHLASLEWLDEATPWEICIVTTGPTITTSPLGSITAEQFVRLIANLLRHEPDGTRVVMGTHSPSPVPGDREPLFHDLCLNVTVGDFSRWAPDHIKEVKKQ